MRCLEDLASASGRPVHGEPDAPQLQVILAFWVGSSGDEEKLPPSQAPHILPLQTLASYKLMCLLNYLSTCNCDTLPPSRRKWGDSSVRVSILSCRSGSFARSPHIENLLEATIECERPSICLWIR